MTLREFPDGPDVIPATRHDRLEIFCPLTGAGSYRIGQHVEEFEPTDILLIDSFQLHGVASFAGQQRHALVVVFSPDLIAPPGALPCDLWLLRPFRHLRDGCLHLHSREPHAAETWDALSRLVMEYAHGTGDTASQARQKLALSELLIVLSQAFERSIGEQSDEELRKEGLRRLSPLFDFLAANLDEPQSVGKAARMVRMSAGYFMRFFRNATGMTFCAYVDQLRVSRAYELLLETDLSLAQIAEEMGFCDQCHLSRHIRRRYGAAPGRLRSQQRARQQTRGTHPGN